MTGRLSRRDRIVVTTATYTEHLRMVYPVGRDLPPLRAARRMTALAIIGGADMCAVLALGAHTVVTEHATAQQFAVIGFTVSRFNIRKTYFRSTVLEMTLLASIRTHRMIFLFADGV